MAAYWPTFYLYCGQLVDSKCRIENRNWPTFDSLEDAKTWGSWNSINVAGNFDMVEGLAK